MSKDQLTIRDLEQSEYEGAASVGPFVSDEGWEFNPGVPNGAEDGWFTEDLWAAAIPPDGEGDEGYGAGMGPRQSTWRRTTARSTSGSRTATILGQRVRWSILPAYFRMCWRERGPTGRSPGC
jgi:hypothetical protein